MTGADIERRAIGNLTELSRWTPGLSVVDQGSRGSNVVIVRGLHTDALNGSEAAGNNYNNEVATYLGDIPLAVDLRPHDIERVEVLLGPQGTLYLPRRPDTRRRTLEVRGDLFALAHGGAPGSDAGLTFNLPVVERKLALRGSVDRYADPGFIDYDYLLRTPGVSGPEPDLSDPEAVAANLPLAAGREYRGHAVRAALPVVEPEAEPVRALRLPTAGPAGGRAAGQPRAVVRHRAPRLRAPLPGAERPQERAIESGADLGAGPSRFRSFSAYTQEDSREERLNWETRLVSTGDGPWRWVGGLPHRWRQQLPGLHR